MKKLSYLLLTVIFVGMISAAHAQIRKPEPPSQTITSNPNKNLQDEVKKELDITFRFADEFLDPKEFESPTISKTIASIKKALPQYRAQIDKAFSGPHKGEVSLVLMIHPTIFASPELSNGEDVKASQDKVFSLLQKLQPSVLAVEGYVENPLSVNTATDTAIRQYRELGLYPERDNVQQLLILEMSKFGALRYLRTNTRTLTLGSEDETLFHLTAVWMVMRTEINKDGNMLERFSIDNQVATLHRLRSYVALAKLLEEMDKRSSANGALVIGAAHGTEIVKAMQAFGIAGTVYNTRP